jgi:hypothetical protein
MAYNPRTGEDIDPEALNNFNEQERLRREELQKKISSINDNFYKNLNGITPGTTMAGGFEYDPTTGELTEKGKKQQQGYFMAKQITGQDVGQSGLDLQRIKKMRDENMSKNVVNSDIAARAAGDKLGRAQQKAGMSGTDTAGLIADSARRGQMEASAINAQAKNSALDKFAQNVMSMAGINLSTIQAYENMGEAGKPVPTVQYDSGGLFG